jgi:hypothetical protein
MDTTAAFRENMTRRGVEANRIGPRLYQGSRPPFGRNVQKAGFDVLVLCAVEHQPRGRAFPGVEVIHCPMDDADHPPSEHEWWLANAAAQRVAQIVKYGGRALITCIQGRNRSGFVTALALHYLTKEPGRMCVFRVQKGRTEAPALTNDHFVAALATIV